MLHHRAQTINFVFLYAQIFLICLKLCKGMKRSLYSFYCFVLKTFQSIIMHTFNLASDLGTIFKNGSENTKINCAKSIFLHV